MTTAPAWRTAGLSLTPPLNPLSPSMRPQGLCEGTVSSFQEFLHLPREVRGHWNCTSGEARP